MRKVRKKGASGILELETRSEIFFVVVRVGARAWLIWLAVYVGEK